MGYGVRWHGVGWCGLLLAGLGCDGSGTVVAGADVGQEVAAEHVHRGPVRGLAAWGRQVCVLDRDGFPACFGEGGATSGAPSEPLVSLEVGEDFACGLSGGGALRCWGTGATGRTRTPRGRFVALGLGRRHGCAVRAEDGRLACWGFDFDRQSHPPPGRFVAVDGGDAHTCGLRADGTVTCWGADDRGQRRSPPGTFVGLAVAGHGACAREADGVVRCWGQGGQGPVGRVDRVTMAPGAVCWVADGQATCGGVALPVVVGATGVAAGEGLGCVLDGEGRVSCLGVEVPGWVAHGLK